MRQIREASHSASRSPRTGPDTRRKSLRTPGDQRALGGRGRHGGPPAGPVARGQPSPPAWAGSPGGLLLVPADAASSGVGGRVSPQSSGLRSPAGPGTRSAGRGGSTGQPPGALAGRRPRAACAPARTCDSPRPRRRSSAFGATIRIGKKPFLSTANVHKVLQRQRERCTCLPMLVTVIPK